MSEKDTDAEPSEIDMEPVAATREAINQLDPIGEYDLMERLLAQAARVREVVPECIGLSISLLDEDLTFTLVATSHDVATLDAVQYLDGGPCADVLGDPVVRQYTTEELAEQRWQLFADASAAAGVASTLTLPTLNPSGQVTGSVNFYGADPHCFDDHHNELAEIFAAWAPGAVTNADLAFRTRDRAAQTPETMHVQNQVAMAIGVIAERDAVSLEDATRALQESADRAGIDPADLAEAVLRAHRRKQAGSKRRQ